MLSGSLLISAGLSAQTTLSAPLLRLLGPLARRTMASAPSAVSPALAAAVTDPGLLKASGLVGGGWVDSGQGGASFEVLNPATGASIASFPKMGAGETAAAIKAAEEALPAWRALSVKSRAAVLRKWHDLILENTGDLACIMTAECGKPLAEAKGEIVTGAASVEWFAEEARRVCGDLLASPVASSRMLVMKQPVGVVGAITPWNFPMSMVTRKVAPALAVGCTVVMKPAEATPLTATALGELARRAGIPDGVFNIVAGDAPAIGNAMMASPVVRKIGFTGSTAVGKILLKGAADTVKRVSMELGGNAPFIVFPDADIEAASAGIVGSALRNAGQTCICAARILVHEDAAAALEEALLRRVAALRCGNGAADGVTTGPLIQPEAVERVRAHVEDAVAQGARLVAGGKVPDLPDAEKGGFFYEPTVLADATPAMRVFKEETFGPVVPLFKFKTDAEAVAMANDTEYGLASYFYTKDLARAWRVAEQLDYGMVGVNEIAIGSEVAPFGGIKASGLGTELSKYGLDEFLEKKYVCMGLGS